MNCWTAYLNYVSSSKIFATQLIVWICITFDTIGQNKMKGKFRVVFFILFIASTIQRTEKFKTQASLVKCMEYQCNIVTISWSTASRKLIAKWKEPTHSESGIRNCLPLRCCLLSLTDRNEGRVLSPFPFTG